MRAGLQALLDHDVWADRDEMADAFLAASGFAHGSGAEGRPAGRQLAARLGTIDAVLHNQDNREHDILDSDEYSPVPGRPRRWRRSGSPAARRGFISVITACPAVPSSAR